MSHTQMEKGRSVSPDPSAERREAMIDILASWDLEGALPDPAGMAVVHEYVDGTLDLDEFILKMKAVSLPSAGAPHP
jgi:hypothetical protein